MSTDIKISNVDTFIFNNLDHQVGPSIMILALYASSPTTGIAFLDVGINHNDGRICGVTRKPRKEHKHCN